MKGLIYAKAVQVGPKTVQMLSLGLYNELNRSVT